MEDPLLSVLKWLNFKSLKPTNYKICRPNRESVPFSNFCNCCAETQKSSCLAWRLRKLSVRRMFLVIFFGCRRWDWPRQTSISVLTVICVKVRQCASVSFSYAVETNIVIIFKSKQYKLHLVLYKRSKLAKIKWLYCVKCQQYSILKEALGYLCDCRTFI